MTPLMALGEMEGEGETSILILPPPLLGEGAKEDTGLEALERGLLPRSRLSCSRHSAQATLFSKARCLPCSSRSVALNGLCAAVGFVVTALGLDPEAVTSEP